jgi:hypothetical protein
MKIETYTIESGTVYSIVPFLGPPLSIKVEPDAPIEVHEYAKEQLRQAIKSRAIVSTTKRKTRNFLYKLIDWLS